MPDATRTMDSQGSPGPPHFDLAFIGHYVKDTIVCPGGEIAQDGGAYRYGAHVAAAMGLRTAVVTKLAGEDLPALEELARIGVQVYARESRCSTSMRLVYLSDNSDERTLELTEQAEPFASEDLAGIHSRAYHIGASVRGEVPCDLVRDLAARDAIISLDAQGFVRVVQKRILGNDGWPEARDILPYVYFLKVDAAEAALMTGSGDIRKSICQLAGMGPHEILLTHQGGVLVWADGRTYEAQFAHRELRGRTGRGDTCMAAYLSKRLLGASPEIATTWAAAVTSLKLEDVGPFKRPLAEAEALIRDRRV